MKTPRSIALATVLAACVFGSAACNGGSRLPLNSDDAEALLFGLVEMARKAEEGSHTYPCAAGGESETRAVYSDRWLGDTVWTLRGQWGLDPVECRPARGFPSLEITGDVFFTTEWSAFHGSETWRIEATVEAAFDWRTSERSEFCDEGWTDLSTVFEDVDDGDFGSLSLDGHFCEVPVEIPLSSFPGPVWW